MRPAHGMRKFRDAQFIEKNLFTRKKLLFTQHPLEEGYENGYASVCHFHQLFFTQHPLEEGYENFSIGSHGPESITLHSTR